MKQVLMMTLWALVVSFSIKAVGANAIAITVPTTREGGTPVTVDELDRVRAVCGRQPGDYTDEVLSKPITGPTVDVDLSLLAYQGPGSYYCVFTAIDTDGRESLYSPESVIEIQAVTFDSMRPGRIALPANKALIIIDWQQ